MSILSTTQFGLATAIAVTVLGAASTAQAQTFSYSGSLPGSQTVLISDDGGQNYGFAQAGRYHGTLANAPINIFCVDIGHQINKGDTYQANTQYHITDAKGSLTGSYYAGGLASAITSNDLGSVTVTAVQASQRASEVAWLADNYLNATAFTGSGDTDLTNNFTAINLSIWDIVRDGGDGLTNGSVRSISFGSQSSLVGYYEALAASQTAYQSSTAMWIQAPVSESGYHLQDYVYEKSGGAPRPPAVPEPGVPTMLLCLGLVAGAVVLRRKRQVQAG